MIFFHPLQKFGAYGGTDSYFQLDADFFYATTVGCLADLGVCEQAFVGRLVVPELV